MKYLALATDYDGTLARDGRVTERTVNALERLGATGREILMVTGRQLEDLLRIFPQAERFARIVAENGAVVFDPATRNHVILTEPPSPLFLDKLREREVPFSVGRGIVATRRPHEVAILQIIRELGLELQVVFNKGAVMVLPSGVNKSSGLLAALAQLGIAADAVVGVGDAENDHAFLAACGFGVAVANALPSLKERADLVTVGDHGDGVVELIDRMIADDLGGLEKQVAMKNRLSS